MIIHEVDQRTQEWFDLRCGMPTGSNFKKIVTSTGAESKSISTYASSLAATMYAGEDISDFKGNADTERGNELEDTAIAMYEIAKGVDVKRIGFVTDDDCIYGVSPDGLVGYDGLVEIKCPRASTYMDYIKRWHDNLTIDPQYVAQVQGQMMVTGRKWCDLVFYYEKLPLLICRVQSDKKFHEKLVPAIHKVIEERDRMLRILKEVEQG